MTNDYNCPQFKCHYSDICEDWGCKNCLNYICEYCSKFECCDKRIELDKWEGMYVDERFGI